VTDVCTAHPDMRVLVGKAEGQLAAGLVDAAKG
jgi:hypothetical protein